MPLRNSWEKFWDAASRSPNETGCSPSINRSDMFTPHSPQKHAPERRFCPAVKAKSFEIVSGAMRPVFLEAAKKEPPHQAAQVITGRRKREWTGATRRPQNGQSCHGRRTLIERKFLLFFRQA